MLGRLANYLLYNNSFTLLILFVVLSGGTAMAANEDVREAVISSEDTLRQVDNRYLLDTNVWEFDFQVQIGEITEDEEFYYVVYTYRTIEIHDGIWQPIGKEDVLQIAKRQVGDGDLGSYIAKELNEFVLAQRTLLGETQEIEHSIGRNTKVVERSYAGLVGQFLGSKELTYEEEPVVVVVDDVPPIGTGTTTDTGTSTDTGTGTSTDAGTTTDSGTGTSTATSTNSTSTATTTNSTSTSNGGGSNTQSPSDTTPPVITLSGSGSVTLTVGDAYSDQGATANDAVDGDLTASITVDDPVDASTAGTYTVTYTVTDAAGNTATKTRSVTVEAAPEPEPEPEPTPEPEPQPEPEPPAAPPAE